MSESSLPEVSFVEYGSQRTRTVRAHVTSDVTVAELYAAATALVEEFDFAESVRPELSDGAAALVVTLKSADPYGDAYMTEERREALATVLQPKCTRKVSATALIVRNGAGKHLQTRVTLTLAAGDQFTGIKAKQYDGSDGVLRCRVGSDAHTVVFTMETPAANDDDGAITKVVETLAGKIKAMVVYPVAVDERNPDAALDPTNDWSAETAD